MFEKKMKQGHMGTAAAASQSFCLQLFAVSSWNVSLSFKSTKSESALFIWGIFFLLM